MQKIVSWMPSLNCMLLMNWILYTVEPYIYAILFCYRYLLTHSFFLSFGFLQSNRYTYDKQYDKTLHIYLRLRRGNAFDLIQEHNLFDSIRDKVALLMTYDQEKAVQLLVSNTDRVPVRL